MLDSCLAVPHSRMHPPCHICEKAASFTCSACDINVYYCSQECQALHWPQHQFECRNSTSLNSSNTNRLTSTTYPHEPIELIDMRQPDALGIHHPTEMSQQELSAEEIARQEKAEEAFYFIGQIHSIVQPVMICILLSIFWVKLTRPSDQYYGYIQLSGGLSGSVATVFTGEGRSSADNGSSLNTAFILMGVIVGQTLLLFVLFKYAFMKVRISSPL